MSYSRHGIFIKRHIEQAHIIPTLRDVGHDVTIEFGVALNGDHFLGEIQGWHFCPRCISQLLDFWRVMEDDVAMHLM